VFGSGVLERRGGNILIFVCLVQYLRGEGSETQFLLPPNWRDLERSKIPYKLNFCFPPNWRDLEGKGEKLF
jgi:hypothetical protein